MAPRSRVHRRAWLHATLATALIDNWRDIVLLVVALAVFAAACAVTGAPA